jgi:small subunit ribosomal protein S16
MIRLRLAMHGVRHDKFFHLVAIDSKKRRDAKPLELLGIYNPRTSNAYPEKRVQWSVDRIKHYLRTGAEPSRSVVRLLTLVCAVLFCHVVFNGLNHVRRARSSPQTLSGIPRLSIAHHHPLDLHCLRRKSRPEVACCESWSQLHTNLHHMSCSSMSPSRHCMRMALAGRRRRRDIGSAVFRYFMLSHIGHIINQPSELHMCTDPFHMHPTMLSARLQCLSFLPPPPTREQSTRQDPIRLSQLAARKFEPVSRTLTERSAFLSRSTLTTSTCPRSQAK